VRAGYWWPTRLSLVQESTQYEVGYGDYARWSGLYSGQLVAGTVTIGILAVPARIDTTKPFRLYYDGVMKGEMGPFAPGA